jgi:ABC-type branched-subunit amino acid transport system ATPase component
VITDVARAHVAGGGTIVLVTSRSSRGLADTVLVLDRGQLIAGGHPDEIDYLAAG